MVEGEGLWARCGSGRGLGVFWRAAPIMGERGELSGVGTTMEGPSLAWAPRRVPAMCSCFCKF